MRPHRYWEISPTYKQSINEEIKEPDVCVICEKNQCIISPPPLLQWTAQNSSKMWCATMWRSYMISGTIQRLHMISATIQRLHMISATIKKRSHKDKHILSYHKLYLLNLYSNFISNMISVMYIFCDAPVSGNVL